MGFVNDREVTNLDNILVSGLLFKLLVYVIQLGYDEIHDSLSYRTIFWITVHLYDVTITDKISLVFFLENICAN
ncbi:unknown [Bacteroides sp. CAG:20]|nr:unknown [Bacteroides sp. CAG:20]